jgi:hypothetical protein
LQFAVLERREDYGSRNLKEKQERWFTNAAKLAVFRFASKKIIEKRKKKEEAKNAKRAG